MGVSVEADWIERYNAAGEREMREADDQKGRKIERGLLIAYAVSLAGAAAMIVASV
jgi:hypothetical protein